jgi:glycosyltransferase involved in cell wall biosynthesis
MKSPIRILELRSVRGTGGGPEKTILLGAARSDPAQYSITVCYIRDSRDSSFGPASRAGQLPIDYVEVYERHSFDPSIWPKIRQIIRERKIQIVHAHDYKTDLLASLLAKHEQVIPLSTAHGWTGDTRREQIYYWADKRILRKFKKVIAVSGQIRGELLRNKVKSSRIEVILNGIDPDRFRRDHGKDREARQSLGLPPDKIIIGSAGRLEPQKNFKLLINAVADLRKEYPALFLAISGDGSLRSVLQQLADQSGLNGACKFLGHKNGVIPLYSSLDLFVQSSIYEGTSNAVLEAMALEVPIVATDVGGTAELVRDGLDGILIPSGNKDALCAAIKRVLDDKESALCRAKAARARAETDLSFETRMGKLESVYRNLVTDMSPEPAAMSCEVQYQRNP